MPLDKSELIKYSIEKADQALKTAYDNLDKDLITANNRVYYSVFYAVTALAYIDNYVTSSHKSLMGWFNKKYIYEDKAFDPVLSKIYSQLLRNRTRFDYNIAEFPDKETVIDNYNKAKLFVNTLREYIKGLE
ncbi:MAG: HEPN domain-containing protein [Cyanobacteriota bacterium]